MPKPDDSVFPELRDKLAKLIRKRADVEVIASDSKVPLQKIDFTGSATHVWQDILLYCESHSIQERLVQVVCLEFPKNMELAGLCQRWIGNLPPTPQNQPPQTSPQPIIKSSLVGQPASDIFDVFLSYNKKDRPAVQELRRNLEFNSFKALLDEEDLPPGVNWLRLLDNGITNSRSIAVFVGEHGIGPWETGEMDNALRHAVKDGRPAFRCVLSDFSVVVMEDFVWTKIFPF